MIKGEVTDSRAAVVPVVVRGPSGLDAHVDAVLDMGFTDCPTLPASVVASLRLTFTESREMMLADSSIVELATYEALVVPNGTARRVPVQEVEGDALLGMSTFYDSRVTLDVVGGGPVTIEATA